MIRALSIWWFLTASLAWADENSDRLAAAGVKEFTAAYQAWDPVGFAKAADLFGQACAQAPGSGTNFYWKGAAEFHRLLQLLGAPARTNRTAEAKAIKATIKALTTAVELNESDAESHALLANVYGISIAASRTRALWLGPRVLKHQKQALEHGPANPRVQYLIGMCQYHGPESLGGKKEALPHLLKAEELFADEAGRPAGPLEPRWGRSTCLAFIGKTCDALGKPAEAEKYFHKSLELNPQDQLAREELAKRKK
jgi:tetratricopeptide (TPR) repeat protein